MDTGAQFGTNTGAIGAVLVAGVAFGTLYALLVNHLSRSGRLEGFTSLAVVAGVLVTVGLAAIVIGWLPTLFVLLVFVATGTPMIIGDIWSYTNQRSARSEHLRGLFEHDDGDRT